MLGVLAGWTLVMIPLLAYQIDRLERRLKALERRESDRASQPRLPGRG